MTVEPINHAPHVTTAVLTPQELLLRLFLHLLFDQLGGLLLYRGFRLVLGRGDLLTYCIGCRLDCPGDCPGGLLLDSRLP